MRSLITWFLNLVMQLEAVQQAGAEAYERTDARTCHRNGSKDRSLVTRFGEISLKKPQFREKPFETQVFGKYARVEKALVNAIAESYLQGVSTRKVQTIIAHLGIDQLSPSSVSRIARDLDDQVLAFLDRPIEQAFPYLFVDASYYKVRDGPGMSRKLFSSLPVSGRMGIARCSVLGLPRVKMRRSGPVFSTS